MTKSMIGLIPSLLFSMKAAAVPPPMVDFSQIPVATTYQESIDRLGQRKAAVLDFWVKKTAMPDFGKASADSFAPSAIARLALGVEVEVVNRKIQDSRARAYDDVGTDIVIIPGICERKGDYDFMLIGLVNLASLFKDQPDLLWPDSRRKLLHHLLTQRGNRHHLSFVLGSCNSHVETENHILMIEVSRYLTNQLLLQELREEGKYIPQYDNAANGFNDWMLRYLQQFFRNDFSEYNSKPYQGYTVQAISILHAHAQEPRVKLAARMLLDFLSAKFAIQSNQLRRSVPFRRQPQYQEEARLFYGDAESSRHAVLVGNYGLYTYFPYPFQTIEGSNFMLTAAMGEYRVPEIVADFILDKKPAAVYQRFRHQGVELYSSSKNFLISAGGIFVNIFDFGTGERVGRSVPTTLMPTSRGDLRTELVRLNGHRDLKFRNNACVARNFACGLNPVVPPNIPAACQERIGPWTFLNFRSLQCPMRYGFYVAVFSAPCDGFICQVGDYEQNFGFFEAVEGITQRSYEDFKRNVLAKNGNREFVPDDENIYYTASGDSIQFVPALDEYEFFGISAINGVVQTVNFPNWPLAEGDWMSASGDGKIIVKHPYRDAKLILDMSQPLNPRRVEEASIAEGR